jgi:hypothetical protein
MQNKKQVCGIVISNVAKILSVKRMAESSY